LTRTLTDREWIKLDSGSRRSAPDQIPSFGKTKVPYPAWFAIENGPLEIVDLPIENGDFP